MSAWRTRQRMGLGTCPLAPGKQPRISFVQCLLWTGWTEMSHVSLGFFIIIIQLIFIKHPVCESAHGGMGPSYRSKLNWETLGHKTGYTCQLPGFCQLLVFGTLPSHSQLPSTLWGRTQHLVILSNLVQTTVSIFFQSHCTSTHRIAGLWSLTPFNPLSSWSQNSV